MCPWFLSLLSPGLPRWQWGELAAGMVLFSYPYLPDFGITEMPHLYIRALILDHEIFRGYTRIKINILSQKVKPRHKCGVSICALSIAILLNPCWFGTAGGDHQSSVPGRSMVLKSNFVPSPNETQQKY